MWRKKTCQGNLKILPEQIFYPYGEKNWKQIFKCSKSRKEQRVGKTFMINKHSTSIFQAFSKKLRGSHGLHLWTDHSSIVQVGDMQEACPLISLAEDHCPLTFIREIRSSMPTKVSGKFED